MKIVTKQQEQIIIIHKYIMFSTLTTQQRILYFLVGCIGTRTIIAISFGVSFLYL